jgi:hypothetical protein
MITTEDVEVSKLYSFRVKVKYRYSFGGSDTIWVVPSERFYYPEESTIKANFFGDMAFNLANKADNYLLDDNTLIMEKDEYTINSTIFRLKGEDFLHLIELKSDKAPTTKSCSRDSDCIDFISSGHCKSSDSKCYYNISEPKIDKKIFTQFEGAPLNEIKGIEITSDAAEEVFITEDLTNKGYCGSVPFLRL